MALPTPACDAYGDDGDGDANVDTDDENDDYAVAAVVVVAAAEIVVEEACDCGFGVERKSAANGASPFSSWIGLAA